MGALGRLMAQENTASDLLAYLVELDPIPLAEVLSLPAGEYTALREARAGGRRSRLDLLVCRVGTAEPVAILELKGASGEHGDQLERYAEWAANLAEAPRLMYCTLDGGTTGAPPAPWQPLSLIDLFGAWQSSAHPHAAWLAGEMTSLLQQWDRQADGLIGSATGWYIPDLITRRIAAALGDEAEALRTKAGNPMLLAYRRHPGHNDAWLGVDLRCEGRDRPERPWLFRPYIEVSFNDPTPQAQTTARHLAVDLHHAMTLDTIQRVVKNSAVLTANKHGGLMGFRDFAPVFYHDKQVRLATQFKLDVCYVDRHQVADMIRAVMDHLDSVAAELHA
ncbi:hypothetical protein Acy02nite_47120 [Actinoplanes cyaneus]|uniref:PD-(D/E)XK nuclease superfamily protein n=1 Tax=Actinoplanes cyaneus TaxID=52696 RepID=A0A919MD62_9ACTN|nr:hypothetical protein [Actinoplanes cyaneus]MCW2138833.1 hypothetical protein [Actinoplanes cyaneus]GID66831.1 hypothetical protein Acy02nite_47120 [Actinoplanes cyaneus]